MPRSTSCPAASSPQPELYGLAIFNEMFGRGSELEKVRLSNPRKLALKAWAVRSGRVLKLLLVNKGRSMARVELPASRLSGAPARIEFLKAPSPRAKTGVTLGGRTIGSDARWHGAAGDGHGAPCGRLLQVQGQALQRRDHPAHDLSYRVAAGGRPSSARRRSRETRNAPLWPSRSSSSCSVADPGEDLVRRVLLLLACGVRHLPRSAIGSPYWTVTFGELQALPVAHLRRSRGSRPGRSSRRTRAPAGRSRGCAVSASLPVRERPPSQYMTIAPPRSRIVSR